MLSGSEGAGQIRLRRADVLRNIAVAVEHDHRGAERHPKPLLIFVPHEGQARRLDPLVLRDLPGTADQLGARQSLPSSGAPNTPRICAILPCNLSIWCFCTARSFVICCIRSRLWRWASIAVAARST